MDTPTEVEAAGVDVREASASVDVLGLDLELSFVPEYGDDNASCVGAPTCTVMVIFHSTRNLAVRVSAGGAPVEGVSVRFEIVDDKDGAGVLSRILDTTDATGVASTDLEIISSGSPYLGVRASIEGADVAPIFFLNRPHVDNSAYLTVAFTYEGSHMIAEVWLYLYRNGDLVAPDVTCDPIDPESPPTADLVKGPKQLSQTFKFVELPGLEEEGEQFYTLLAHGALADGTLVAAGCDDEKGHVSLTTSRHVQIRLEDLSLPPTCPAAPGCPCQDSATCGPDAVCADSFEGRFCTPHCLMDADCPPLTVCRHFETGAPEEVFACLDPYARQCRPCSDDDDCALANFGATGVCVLGDEKVGYCSVACHPGVPCPTGSDCQHPDEDGGQPARCRPSEGAACP